MDQRARIDEIREQWREFGAHVKAGRSVEPGVPLALAYATQVGDLLAIVADLEATNAQLVARVVALEEAGNALAAVVGPSVDFIQSFDSENAQSLALLLALQEQAWCALVPASSTGTPPAGEGEDG